MPIYETGCKYSEPLRIRKADVTCVFANICGGSE